MDSYTQEKEAATFSGPAMSPLNLRAAEVVYGPATPIPQAVAVGLALWSTETRAGSGDTPGTVVIEHPLAGGKPFVLYPTAVWPVDTSGYHAIPGYNPELGGVELVTPWPCASLMFHDNMTALTGPPGRGPVVWHARSVYTEVILWRLLGEPEVDTSSVRWEPLDYENDTLARLALLSDARKGLPAQQWRRVTSSVEDPSDFLDPKMLEALVASASSQEEK